MRDKKNVIRQIRESFQQTHHPGDNFLQGSFEGDEPYEVTAAFQGVIDWSQVDPQVLDHNYSALSFFSEGAFRYFLPAYLIADLNDELDTADPLFHLTNGFSNEVLNLPGKSRTHQKVIGRSEFINPRRYGAMTSYDYARSRLSVFTKEEASAIVEYLEYRREQDTHGIETSRIEAALIDFWRDRAAHAPGHRSLQQYIESEDAYLNDIQSS